LFLTSPVGLILAGVLGLSMAIYAVSRAMKSQTTLQKVNNQVTERALANSIDQRVEAKLLFTALRNAEVGTKKYNEVLEKIDKLSPGLTQKYNLQAGAIENINKAEKELTESILNRAKTEARSELLREKTKELLQLQSSGPSFVEGVMEALFGKIGGYSAIDSRMKDISSLNKEIEILADQITAEEQKPINPEFNRNEMLKETFNTNNANVNLNINDPNNRITAESYSPFVRIMTTSTLATQ